MRTILSIMLLLGLFPIYLNASIHSPKHTYYVSNEGDDSSDGSMKKPFKTIAYAVSVLVPGDVLYIRGGEYYETLHLKKSGTAEHPIIISNYLNEDVSIYGADLIETAWKGEGKNRWSANLPPDFSFFQHCQVFKGDRALVEARYPNMPGDGDMSLIGEYGPFRAIAQLGTDKEGVTFEKEFCSDLTGAGICIWPGAYGVSAWGPSCRKVKQIEGNKILFDKEMQSINWFGGMDPDTPHPGNPYFVFGHKELLDNENEYYIDENLRKIYVMSASNPRSCNIKIKKRIFGIQLEKVSHLKIKGFTIVGASLSVTNSDQIVIEKCRFLYPEYVRYPGLDTAQYAGMTFTGKNSVFQNNEIAYSSISGLSIQGSNLTIKNNYIHDIACTGSGAGVFIDKGTEYAYLGNNTIIRSGRSHFLCPGGKFGEGTDRFNEKCFEPVMIKEVIMEYNYLQDHNTYTSDCALFYAWNVDGQGTKFRSNYCIETLNEKGEYKYTNGTMDKQAQGLYSDNFCRNMEFYNNIVVNQTTGIQVNNFCINIQYFNNVIINPLKEIVATFGYPETPGYMKQTRIYDNTFYTADTTKNYYLGIHSDRGSFECLDESRQLYVKKVSFDGGRSITKRYNLSDNSLVYVDMGIMQDTTFEIKFDQHDPALRNVESTGNRLFTSPKYGTAMFLDRFRLLPDGQQLDGYGCDHCIVEL